MVRVLGDMEDGRIPLGAREALMRLERDTVGVRGSSDNGDPLTLCLALNYGGRRDILNAVRKMAQLLSEEGGDDDIPSSSSSTEQPNNNDDTDEAMLNGLLSTSGMPDPDIIIRTGGERRLSNFLIWNCAYAELYFTDVLWPDFKRGQLDEALEWYRRRERRFGGRSGGTTERLEEGREWS